VTTFVAVRATVALVGIAVWAYGARFDVAGVRWAGIALLGAAFLLRFVDKAKRR
jgi:hypothetical protein